VTPAEFRRYVADPARGASPAARAARAALADRDRLAAAAARLAEQVRELTADVECYRRENERLRGLLAATARAPWEGDGADG
jgi:hypothetical protein